MKKKVAVLIPTYNRADIVEVAVKTLLKNKESYLYDVFVVNNGSTDKTKSVLSRFKNIYVLHNNKNYFASKALNQLFTKFKIEKRYEFSVIMAHDVLMKDGSVAEMVKILKNDSQVGITAPVYYEFETGKLRTCGLSISHWTSLLKNHLQNSVEGIDHFVSCFALRSSIYKKLRGLDDVLFPMIYEEPDFGERILKLGLKLRPSLKAKIWHPIQPGKVPGYRKKETQLVDERMYGNPAKAYLFFRNRIIFMSKYVNLFQFLVFYFLFNPIISLYYLRTIDGTLRNFVFLGLIDGTKFALNKNRDYIAKKNKIMLNI